MPEYRAPGVYVEETSFRSRAIAAVETAIPVFIGYTRKVSARGSAVTAGKPRRVADTKDFAKLYGQSPLHDMAVNVVKRVDAAGRLLDVAVTWDAFDPVPSHFLSHAVQLYFANGGTDCFVHSLGRFREARKADFLAALQALEDFAGPTLLVLPDAALLDDADHAAVLEAALASAARSGGRFVIADVPRAFPGSSDTAAEVDARFRAGVTGDPALLRNGVAYFPYLETELPLRTSDGRIRFARFDVVTVARDGSETTASVPGAGERAFAVALKSKEPEVYRAVKAFIAEARATLPPSGAVAGLFARIDATRGVWEVPAGAALLKVARPAVAVNDTFHETLNNDSAGGKSVNAVRFFTGRGNLVWGARTLAGNDNEWRYVNVRRFALFLEASIDKGTQWAVFEPNDANTWTQLRMAVEDFLLGLWRQGALQGTKPEQAFTVQVGLGSTMTQQDIDQGRLILQVGFAPLRPAEFVMLRIVHEVRAP